MKESRQISIGRCSPSGGVLRREAFSVWRRSLEERVLPLASSFGGLRLSVGTVLRQALSFDTLGPSTGSGCIFP